MDIHEFKKKLTSQPELVWKPGRIETTSPNPDEKVLAIEYVVFAGGTSGRFRLQSDHNNPAPGRLFQMPRDLIMGWQRGTQKFQLENGKTLLVPGEFINEDGFFKTGE